MTTPLDDLRYEVDRVAQFLSEAQADRDGYKAERDRLRAVVDGCLYCSAVADTLDVSPTGEDAVTPEELGNPDWYAESTVEIGGEVMRRSPGCQSSGPSPHRQLVAERDRLRAVVDEYQRADRSLSDAIEDPEVEDATAEAALFRKAQDALLALDVSPTIGGES